MTIINKYINIIKNDDNDLLICFIYILKHKV